MLEKIIDSFNLDVASVEDVKDSFSSTVTKCHLADGNIVYIKIPFSSLKLHRELEAYEVLSEHVSTPRLIDYWSGDDQCVGALLLSALNGSPLSTESTPDTAYQVGMLHAQMHAIHPEVGRPLTSIVNEFPNWAQFIEHQFLSFAEDVKQVLDPQLYRRALNQFEKMRQGLPVPDGPSFIHMDFRPANIIVDGQHVSGVIDFESVRFGSTEIDFTKLYRDYLRHDEALYLAYREGYNTIRPLIDLDRVLPFYRFTDAFNSIGWCQRRGIEENLQFFEANVDRLKDWL
ncbi:aminoglycoside phosphotransferase family protein [Exiguobacterium algae]|uniref:aminoglycoside phosphotransferase family protein n=1 Tax=Exiguobacterium algae TaxID=2751250 RepID=UPI001BE9EAC5|nr:aminoglycoside phosphotransferase family protein [Exiguobacterium algae]